MSTSQIPGILPPVGKLMLGGFPLTRNTVERGKHDVVEEAIADPRTRVLPLAAGRAPVIWQEDTARLAWRGASERPPIQTTGTGVRGYAHLGYASDGAPVLLDCADPSTADTEAGDPWSPASQTTDRETWLGLRDAAEHLTPEETAWFTTALALANWHATNVFCSVCGSPTEQTHAGWARTCRAEGTEIFPRTDPAIIATVVHTDDSGVERLLLGHSVRWPEDRYSTFAGFVEAGESLESAVAREIAEESGVTVTDAVYLGSQPWPFPRSLMVGFRASAYSLEAAEPDGEEISAVRWFTRAELAAAVRSREVVLPGAISIAHHLITDWYGDALPTPEEV